MIYVEAPNYSVEIDRLPNNECIFLAGSITGAPDWQAEAALELRHSYNVFNPRRKDFDVTAKDVEKQQITWEFHCLDKCDNILFWFAEETLAPITLLEYGKMLVKAKQGNKKLFVGVHPNYARRNDVYIQTRLELDYTFSIWSSLDLVVMAAKEAMLANL